VQRKRIYSLCSLDKKISLGLNWVDFFSSANYLRAFKSAHVKHPLTFAISPIQSITHLNIQRPISKPPDFLWAEVQGFAKMFTVKRTLKRLDPIR
jgi:hypothetical protein